MTTALIKSSYQRKFDADGFVIANVHTNKEMEYIRSFALTWVCSLLEEQNKGSLPGTINNYHIWKKQTQINHNKVFSAKNRHITPTGLIKNLIINKSLLRVLSDMMPGMAFDLWDEGLGWLAFRLIRPGYNDGYPWSCKSWGPAKDCVSVWLPISGCGPEETIAIWPGSHKKRHSKFMPLNSKFTKDEYRLKEEPVKREVLRPDLKENEIIIFGPNTLHSEDVKTGKQSRFNLEFRFQMSAL